MLVPRFLVWLLAGSLVAAALTGQVILSELVASNRAGIRDAQGLSADWVELHNQSAAPASLAGHALVDDRGSAFEFPEVVVPPRGYLVVLLSGKLRRDPARRLHAGFRLSRRGGRIALVDRVEVREVSAIEFGRQVPDVSFGHPQSAAAVTLVERCQVARTLVPRAGLRSDWLLAGFDDSGWREVFGGFGFCYSGRSGLQEWVGTDIGSAMRGRSTSHCVRYRFEVADAAALRALLLRVQCCGGFVAWLNGVEIARLNVPAEIGSDTKAFTWEEGADQRLEHEFEVVPTALSAGQNVLAIRSFSTSAFAFDHLITAELVGYTPGDLQRDRLEYFGTPTPGRPNGSGAAVVAPKPNLPGKSRLTIGSGVLARSPEEAGAGVIRYTTDGRDPVASSAVLPARLELPTSAEVRARRFVPGQLPSPTDSLHFTRLGDELRDYRSDLPMIVVSTHGAPVVTKQWISAHVHAIDRGADGTCGLTDTPAVTTHGAVRLRGSSTLNLPKRSYAIELHRASGRDREVSLFGLAKASEWVLYAPHNYDQSHLRNALCYELARRMGLAAPRWRFCELFVDTDGGEVTAADYQGLYLLVEKIGVGEGRLEIDRLGPTDNTEPEVAGGYVLKIDRPGVGNEGFEAGGQKLQFVVPTERQITEPQRRFLQGWFDRLGSAFTRARAARAGEPVAAREYSQWLDVDAFVDFHFFHEFTKNPDAYTLSTYMHLPRGGKLRMGPVWDFDRAMRTNDDEYWVGRSSRPRGWTSDYRYGWWGELFDDPEFVRRYRERGREWLKTELSPARAIALVREIAAEIARAEERDRKRWPIIAAGRWHDELRELEIWLQERAQWLKEELVDLPFVHSATTFDLPFTLTMRHANASGTLYYTMDGADPKLDDGRVSPSAREYRGESFEITTDTRVRARVLVDGVWSRITERSFVQRVAELAVSEVMYNPEEGHRSEFVELWNYGDEAIDLSHIEVDGAIRFHFGAGAVRTLAPGGRVLIVNDLDTFLARYDAVGLLIAGEFLGSLSNTADSFVVRGGVGELIARVSYDDGWYRETDGKGRALVLRVPARECVGKTDWRAGQVAGGTPGRQ
ncbi:MAG: CotH kinase family protein [bacterium]|nr:CotH kinase family protein [bacterium]